MVTYILRVFCLKTLRLLGLLEDSPFQEDIEHITRCFDKTTKPRFRDVDEPQYVKFGSTRDNDPTCNIRFGQLKLAGLGHFLQFLLMPFILTLFFTGPTLPNSSSLQSIALSSPLRINKELRSTGSLYVARHPYAHWILTDISPPACRARWRVCCKRLAFQSCPRCLDSTGTNRYPS